MKRKKVMAIVLLGMCLLFRLVADPLGDVDSNGRITIVDALMTAQFYVGLDPEGFDEWAADVSGDGDITIIDALMIAKYYVELIDTFPASGNVTPTPTPDPTPSPTSGTVSTLHTSGNWIKDSYNNNVVLKGVALADIDAIYKGDRSQRVGTTVFDIIDIASSPGWNVDVIRLTVHPRVEDETGNHGWLNYSPDDYFNDILDPAVQYVVSKEKYVIVDWHYVGESWDNGSVISNTENFWNYIAPRYANHPNIIFELFNEPGYGDWNSWQPRAQGWVNLIRNNHNASNLIIVGGPMWSQVTPSNNSQLLSGGNIVYSCHIYPQHGIPNWIDWIANAAPVMMTEWGYESQATEPVNGTSSWAYQYKSYINSKPNVGWVAWCFDFVYRSVMFDQNWVLLGNGQSSNYSRFHGGPTDNYTNYMGQFVKDWLAE